MAHGKRYRQQYGKVQRDHVYPPAEAISLIKETASAKFDESVELHVRLGVNRRSSRLTQPFPRNRGKGSPRCARPFPARREVRTGVSSRIGHEQPPGPGNRYSSGSPRPLAEVLFCKGTARSSEEIWHAEMCASR